MPSFAERARSPIQAKGEGGPSILTRRRLPVETAAAPAALPEALRSGAEALGGFSLADVKVHRDSPEPAKLGALAFARGSDIHLGKARDQHLGHEAWHVVQQKQGRVRPTAEVAGVGVNVDASLEAEADRMGRLLNRPSTVAAGPAPRPAAGGMSPQARTGVSETCQLQLDGEPQKRVTPSDNTNLSGVRDAVQIKWTQFQDATAAKKKQVLGAQNAHNALKSLKQAPADYKDPNAATVGPAKTKTPDDKRFSELMNMEMKYRKEYLTEYEQKMLEESGGIASEYVQAQLYLLQTKSTARRLFDQDSPVSLWRWLRLVANAFGRDSSVPGKVRTGMRPAFRSDPPGTVVPNKELLFKPPG
jgi:hypothetical protein